MRHKRWTVCTSGARHNRPHQSSYVIQPNVNSLLNSFAATCFLSQTLLRNRTTLGIICPSSPTRRIAQRPPSPTRRCHPNNPHPIFRPPRFSNSLLYSPRKPPLLLPWPPPPWIARPRRRPTAHRRTRTPSTTSDPSIALQAARAYPTMSCWASWAKALSGTFPDQRVQRMMRYSYVVGCACMILTPGNHSEVHKARSKKTGALIALKKIIMHHEKDGVCTCSISIPPACSRQRDPTTC